jgi:oligopeptide/dipeptide ABC transporter ATP-binding protein
LDKRAGGKEQGGGEIQGPGTDTNNIIEVNGLKVYYDLKDSFTSDVLLGRKRQVRAVDDVSFAIGKGEVLSLVGESGSGKTTTGKAILQLLKITEGDILFRGERIDPGDKAFMKGFRQKAQMIFQDPYQALNPRNFVLDLIAEPLDVNRLVGSVKEREERVILALEQAGLSPGGDYLYRYPHELSGGQRQRVVIAGAMIMNPDFIVADEPVSMLDASIRTGILKLMMQFREERELAYLFITHDLSLAWLIADRIAIMYLGGILEIGRADDVIKRGLHPYTQALTAIMPIPGVNTGKERVTLPGEIPSASEEIIGCKFRSRCDKAMDICARQRPVLKEIEESHFTACHLYKAK